MALPTLAQMFIVCVTDLDPSLGAFVSLLAFMTATWVNDTPLLGYLSLLGLIALYAITGALIHLWALPSIVVMPGMSFVWLGLAVLVLPTPGGAAPEWIRWLMTVKSALAPSPIIALIVMAFRVLSFPMRSALRTVLRGAGGSPKAFGPGHVDLSIPARMTLAGTIAMKAMDGSAAMLPVSLTLAGLVGLGLGAFNYLLTGLLCIPPTMATLRASFSFQSAAIWWSRRLRIKPPELSADFPMARIAGI